MRSMYRSFPSVFPLAFSLAFAFAFTGCDFTTSSMPDTGDNSSSTYGMNQGRTETSASVAAEGPMGNPVLNSTSGASLGKLAAGSVFQSSFEDQSASCWGNRNSSGYALTSCGEWGDIGTSIAQLAEGAATSHSGTKSMRVTFGKNEDVGGATLTLSADVVNVRSYYNFASGFDFGQGIKIGRVSSFNDATQSNDMDMVLEVRSEGAQCGLTDMADIGVFFNGKPLGYDWGNVAKTISFQRNRWYAVEYQVKLNAPGANDGSVSLWIDGNLVASRRGLNLRGNGGSSVKINRVRVGGWYSNSARGNTCANPSQPSTMYVDDVAVGSDYIGTGDARTAFVQSNSAAFRTPKIRGW